MCSSQSELLWLNGYLGLKEQTNLVLTFYSFLNKMCFKYEIRAMKRIVHCE
ncbi:hypothetical protein RUMHYD_02044 [Blautia hydrogenotrophica DSM 10507]|uniref:Uncharacterized protein n=1 Tax=Blautia hydrogenotrophica (strain DSM 10507 / JCM 14656 / S5a33) TaxID=476272 RepID=C0CMG1_BLAHS|nr:hypothetical protein RUMHYD_02044 [Blautia hydrogenotrophica DSM 10507]